MLKVAITGNIGAGKTTAQKYIEKHFPNIPTLDADAVVADLYLHNDEVKQAVLDVFKKYGDEIKDEKGEISKVKLGDIVFKDADKRNALQDAVHPAVKKEIENFFKKNEDKDIVVVSVPLLFEAKMQDMFDKIILITADWGNRLERLMNRNKNLSEEDALLRMKSQMPQEDKIELSDYIVDNNGTIEETEKQVINIFNDLKNLI